MGSGTWQGQLWDKEWAMIHQAPHSHSSQQEPLQTHCRDFLIYMHILYIIPISFDMISNKYINICIYFSLMLKLSSRTPARLQGHSKIPTPCPKMYPLS